MALLFLYAPDVDGVLLWEYNILLEEDINCENIPRIEIDY